MCTLRPLVRLFLVRRRLAHGEAQRRFVRTAACSHRHDERTELAADHRQAVALFELNNPLRCLPAVRLQEIGLHGRHDCIQHGVLSIDGYRHCPERMRQATGKFGQFRCLFRRHVAGAFFKENEARHVGALRGAGLKRLRRGKTAYLDFNRHGCFR